MEMLSPIGKILSLIWEMLSLVWAILSPNFGERLSPERGEFQLVSLAPAHHSFSGDRRGGQTKKGGMAPTLSLSLSLSLLIRGVEKGPLARDRVNQTFLPSFSLSFFPPPPARFSGVDGSGRALDSLLPCRKEQEGQGSALCAEHSGNHRYYLLYA